MTTLFFFSFFEPIRDHNDTLVVLVQEKWIPMRRHRIHKCTHAVYRFCIHLLLPECTTDSAGDWISMAMLAWLTVFLLLSVPDSVPSPPMLLHWITREQQQDNATTVGECRLIVEVRSRLGNECFRRCWRMANEEAKGRKQRTEPRYVARSHWDGKCFCWTEASMNTIL